MVFKKVYMETKVLLVDDHTIFRRGLYLLLNNEKGIRVVGETGDGQTAIDLICTLLPDVVVIDITMPNMNGIEACRQIASESPDTKVVALSIHSGKCLVEDMLSAGAVGYIMKESAPEELVKGIRAVIDGKAYLSPSITDISLSCGREAPAYSADPGKKVKLTKKEKEALSLLMEGNAIEQIALPLNISPETAKATSRRIMKKLGVNSMAELIKYVRSGLYSESKGPAGEGIHHADGSTINHLPIVGTKLHRPSVPEDHVLRSRLVEQLNHNRKHLLILILAPAGYGKSTLASSWLEASEWPNAWISLDESDNDLHLFLTYLLNAVRTIFPEAVQKTLAMLNAPVLPPPQVLSGSLINELDMIKEDFVLAMDDFHLIRDKSVLELVIEVLRHPPRPLHLALIGRKDPFLPIYTLRAHKQLYELRIEDIRFTAEETAAYLQQMLNEKIEDTTAAMWAERTEGWITGLRLASLSIQHRGDFKSMLPELEGGAQYVMEYLFNEVLSHQSSVVRDYLLKTSILDRFCAPLCEVLSEPGQKETDSRKFIALLKKENMFIINLDTEDRWVRYHYLFHELLKKQLTQHRSPGEIASLHSRVSKWFEENNLVEDAVRHALAAGDVLAAAQIVERNRHAALDADRWQALQTWLDRLPHEIRQERPELLLGKAWILLILARVSEILPIIERVESLLDEDSTEPALLSEINFFRGILCYFQGESARSMELFTKAMEMPPGNSFIALRAEVEYWACMALHLNGQKETAIRRLHEGIRSIDIQEGMILSRLTFGLCFIHMLDGEWLPAFQDGLRLGEVSRTNRLAFAETWAIYVLGNVSFQILDLDAAEHHFSMAVENRYMANTRAAVDAMAGLAITSQFMGKPDEADETMRLAQEYAQWTKYPGNLEIVRSCRARLALLQGDLDPASRWQRSLSKTPGNPVMLFFLEIPVITECRVLITIGSDAGLKDAMERLENLRQRSKTMHNTCQMIDIMVLQALAGYRQGQLEKALEILEQAVVMARSGGSIRPFIEPGPVMMNLLKRLAKKNIAVDYIGRILAVLKSEKAVTVHGVTDDQTVRIQPLPEPLSRRELETLTLLGQGLSNKEIAFRLFLSPGTVKKHVYNIYQKLLVNSRVSAVAKAQKLRILPPG